MDKHPRQIGKYRVQRLLGRGAMGMVYEAYDPDVDRKVALKTVHAHLLEESDGAEFLARLRREAQAAARCNHANIVTVLEYGRDADLHFIAMEFIDGIKLTERLRQRERINFKEIMAIMSQLLKALNAAHKQGIIHRDIKPDNIILLANGKVKLADFGIARLPTSDMTRVGMFMGTPRYTPPEQAEGGKVGPYSDIFAVGIVFSDMLSRALVPVGIPMATLPEIQGLDRIHRIDRQRPIPLAMVPVIMKCLAPDGPDRHQSARELATHLKAAVDLMRKQLAGKAPASASASQPAIPESDLRYIEETLAQYLGPIATSMVDVHARQAGDSGTLVNALANEIQDPADRRAFLRQTSADSLPPSRSGDMNGNTNSVPPASEKTSFTTVRREFAIDPDTLQRLRADFVNYVGPIAATIVDEQISQGSSYSVLLRQMADHIPNEQERQQFLNQWRR